MVHHGHHVHTRGDIRTQRANKDYVDYTVSPCSSVVSSSIFQYIINRILLLPKQHEMVAKVVIRKSASTGLLSTTKRISVVHNRGHRTPSHAEVLLAILACGILLLLGRQLVVLVRHFNRGHSSSFRYVVFGVW